MRARALGWLLVAAVLATGCPMLGRGDEERSWGSRVVVRGDSGGTRGSTEPGRTRRFESPRPGGNELGSPGPYTGQPPGQGEGMAVGWVSVASSDGRAYEVWQEGERRGFTSLRLTQRPGEGTYETRDAVGRRLCRGRVDVRRYEEICLVCDVRTGRFRRGACPP